MALVNLNFESKYLRCNNDVTIMLPDKPRNCAPEAFYTSGRKYKVLYLLHGTFGDHTDWYRHTNIELYACEKNLIVVMPSAINANYQNWPGFGTGYYLYDYILKELMPLVTNWFPASPTREDTFIAGLSMGARGAMKLALENPERFGGVAALSAFPHDYTMDREYFEQAMARGEVGSGGDFAGPFDPDFRAARFRNDILNNGGTIEKYIERVNPIKYVDAYARGLQQMKIYCACGMDDPLYPEYLDFKQHAAMVGLNATFVEEAGYKHEWRFWDKYIEKALEFFGMIGETGGKEFLG